MMRPAAVCVFLLGGLAFADGAAAQTPVPAASAASPAVRPSDGLSPAGGLDAVAIYDRIRTTLAARRIPPFIAYTQYAAFERHGKIEASRDRIVIRTADGKVFDTPIPDSPRDRIDTRPTVEDKPLVYPTTSFGLVKRRSGEQPSAYESSSTPAPADPNAPRIIGRVAAASRDYDPTLVGVEDLDGARVYHLKLVPRFDPQHHPVRDVYADAATFDPRRITIEVFAALGPVHSRPTVTVDFAPVDGTWLIAHASMDFVLRLAFFSYAGSAEFRTGDVSFPAAEPDWMFDSKLLAEHLRATATPPPGTRGR